MTTIKIFDTMEEADDDDAAILLYKLYKRTYNMSFSCNHSDRGYAIVRHGFDLYIFTSKDELWKVMKKYYDY